MTHHSFGEGIYGPTLLLPPRITKDSVRLWRAAVAAGWDTLRLGRWEAPEGIPPAEVAVYGGYFTVLAEQLGVTLLSPAMDWLANIPREFTQRGVRFLPLAEARKIGDRAFYKPSDDKCFLAKVYNSGSELPGAAELPDDVPVLISDIVHWEMEFRSFVLDGKVVTLSPYLRNHERMETPEGEFVASDEEYAAAEAFATRVVSTPGIGLPVGVVVDVGFIRDRGWAVIEANQAWAAGIYGCDAEAILPILRRVCVPV
jgi:hypothetical protein